MAEAKSATEVWGFYSVDIFDCPPFQMFTVGDDPRSYDIIRHRTYEPHSMKLWCRCVSAASCILDVGAHTGIYALSAASLRKDIPIFAFEPQPYTAARLRLHKQLNGFENLHDHALALSDIDGITEVAWTQKQSDLLPSGTRFGHSGEGNNAVVYTKRLDSLDIPYGIAPLVKVDVEGFEVNVFQGASKLIAARPIIILESYRAKKCDAITSLLTNYRFARVFEEGGLEWLDRLRKGDDKGGNSLCIPNERAAEYADLM